MGANNVLHLGADRKCYFFDIYKDGKVSGPQDDDGVLAEEYGYKDDEGDDDGAKSLSEAIAAARGSAEPPQTRVGFGQ